MSRILIDDGPDHRRIQITRKLASGHETTAPSSAVFNLQSVIVKPTASEAQSEWDRALPVTMSTNELK